MRTILVFAVMILACSARTDSGRGEFGHYDRMLAVQGFLDAVYPELRPEQGLLTVRTEEFHNPAFQVRFDFDLCRPGSGVPANGKWAVRPCHGLQLPYPSSFLTLSVTFGKRFPIVVFSASGEFVSGKLEAFRKLVEQHEEWGSEEITDALEQETPRFGPRKRDAFLKAVPVKALHKYTGCRLDLSRAVFVASRHEDSLELPTTESRSRIHWRVPGKKGNQNCSVIFEPFDGRLTSIDAFP